MTNSALPPDVDALLGGLPDDEASDLAEVWSLVGDPPPDDAASADRALARFLDARSVDAPVEAAPTPAPVRSPRRFPRPAPPRAAVRRSRPALFDAEEKRFLRGIGAAAAVALVAVVAVMGWASSRPLTYTAPTGSRLAVSLPDGSDVTLNAGSTLRAPRRFQDTRDVSLVGEAYFEVAHADAPFVVTTPDAEVVVLGTHFGVRAWPSDPDPGTTVALTEGAVRLSPLARPSQAVDLAPGDVRHVGASGAPEAVAEGSTQTALAWRQGDLVYNDRPLGDVLGDVERRFGVDLGATPAALRQRRVSVALRAPDSAEAVVRDLALAFGLRYRARSGGFDLFEPAPPPADTPRPLTAP